MKNAEAVLGIVTFHRGLYSPQPCLAEGQFRATLSEGRCWKSRASVGFGRATNLRPVCPVSSAHSQGGFHHPFSVERWLQKALRQRRTRFSLGCS